MISRAVEAEILRLYHAEGWPIGTICAVSCTSTTAPCAACCGKAACTAVRECARTSKLDAYVPFIQETFARYPTLRASRLYRMVRERGYLGSPDHFRHMVRPMATAAGGRSVSALAHIARGTSADRLGALRQAHHRPRAAAADGLRDGALLLAPSVRAILLERRHGELLGRATCRPSPTLRPCQGSVLYDNLRSAVLERSRRCHPF